LKAEFEGRAVTVPDFLIVGANKGGTTSLYYYLKQHPGIFMPLLKEPNFFIYGGEQPPESAHPKGYKGQIWRFEDYLRLFEEAGEGQVAGEASTPYLHCHKRAISNMKKFIPRWQDLRIVMILRNPVDRAFSQYTMYRLWGVEDLEFEEVLQQPSHVRFTGPGLYYNPVKAYMDNFPHVKVYLFEDLKADALGLVRDLFQFLGVDDSFVPEMKTKYNPSGAPWSRLFHRLLSTPGLISSRVPLIKLIPLETRIGLTEKLSRLNIRKKLVMTEQSRQYLRDFYREDVLKLQGLIGRDLSKWL
jgi:hypothetical protein